jgi:uncharacterized protein YyaL (SSP411 family)
MYAARSRRAAPQRDDKLITAWNALALRAFAEAGAVLGRDDYREIARTTAGFLLQTVFSSGTVWRTWKDGVARIPGFLEDVAHLAAALLTMYESSGEPRFFVTARALCELIVERYRDGGMYYDTAADAEPLIVRPRSLDDNPVLSGQAAAAQAMLRLQAFSGEQRWQDRAMEIVEPLAGVVDRAPLALSGLATAMEMALQPMRQVAVSGGAGDAATHTLVSRVWRRFDPLRVLA